MRNPLIKYRFSLFLTVFSLIIFFAIKLYTGFALESQKENWGKKLPAILKDIDNSVADVISEEKAKINKTFSLLSKQSSFNDDKINSNTQLLKNDLFFIIYNLNNRPVQWSNRTYNFPSGFNINKLNFENFNVVSNPLYIFLVAKKRIEIKGEKLTAVVASPLVKKLQHSAKNYKPINKFVEIEKNYFVKVKLLANGDESILKDGRYHLVSNNSKIGANIKLYYQKPSMNSQMTRISSELGLISVLFLFVSILTVLIILLFELEQIKSKFLQIIALFLLFIGARVVFFVTGFPSNYFDSSLLDPSFFSSSFGYGIVKSPLEFLFSILALLLPSLLGLRIIIKNTIQVNFSNIKKIIFIGISVTFLLLLLRAYGATIKSVVVDSTLLYFTNFELLPNKEVVLMDLNIFLLGIVVTAIFLMLLISIIKIFRINSIKNNVFLFGSVLLLLSIVYHFLQPDPQIPLIIKVLLICILTIIAAYYSLSKLSLKGIVISMLLVASISSVLLMNYYNYKLERESLKEFAVELSRNKSNWYNFLIIENINSQSVYNEIQQGLEEGNTDNLSSIAFKIWAHSSLQRDAVPSRINIFDSDNNFLGGYNFNFTDEQIEKLKPLPNFGIDTIYQSANKDVITFTGIRKVLSESDSLLGFYSVEIEYNTSDFDLIKQPKFIVSNDKFTNTAIDFNKLKLFDFTNGKLNSIFGEVYLSIQQKKELLNSKFSKFNEAWNDVVIGGAENLVYLFKKEDAPNTRIIVAALEKDSISFVLFHFFKVFFIHTLFMLIALILYFSFLVINKRRIVFSLRAKLLVAFLAVSLIPLVFMSIYFQNLTTEKNQSAIFYKLQKRANSVEEYLNSNSPSKNINDLYWQCSKDLNINYTLFDKYNYTFSSEEQYFKAGILPNILPFNIYNDLENNESYSKLVNEQIENYPINTIYQKANIHGYEYLIQVSDVFNPILLPMSKTETSVLLFGTYSFAAILILLTSSLLANQISAPIRRLTVATESVASGDYGIQLKSTSNDEVAQLVKSFNVMVKQLNKSQQELAEKERESAWREMAKQVAHEIKNPLTPMKLSIQQLIIAYKDKHPKFEEIFNKVTLTQIKQIDTLKNIATEFSNFARMPKLKIDSINITEIVKEAIDLFRDEKCDIYIKEELNNYLIAGDKDQTKRMFINLIRNSIQAGATELKIYFEKTNNEIFVRCIDDGSGIPKEIIEKIFDADFTTKLKGMGIGLSMAKRYMGIINGEISIEETSPKGTTILLKFLIKN